MDDQKTLESIIKTKFPKLGSKSTVVEVIPLGRFVLELRGDGSVTWRETEEK